MLQKSPKPSPTTPFFPLILSGYTDNAFTHHCLQLDTESPTDSPRPDPRSQLCKAPYIVMKVSSLRSVGLLNILIYTQTLIILAVIQQVLVILIEKRSVQYIYFHFVRMLGLFCPQVKILFTSNFSSFASSVL